MRFCGCLFSVTWYVYKCLVPVCICENEFPVRDNKTTFFFLFQDEMMVGWI